MIDNQLETYLTRDAILKLLSDEEVANVSNAETKTRLAAGAEYLDLTHLELGIQRAQEKAPSMGPILPRKAVHDDTWTKILGLAKHPSA